MVDLTSIPEPMRQWVSDTIKTKDERIAELEQQAELQLKDIRNLSSKNQRLRDALLNLNAAIDYHWNDSFTGVQRMPDAHAKMIVAAQQVAKQALEAIRKEIEQ